MRNQTLAGVCLFVALGCLLLAVFEENLLYVVKGSGTKGVQLRDTFPQYNEYLG